MRRRRTRETATIGLNVELRLGIFVNRLVAMRCEFPSVSQSHRRLINCCSANSNAINSPLLRLPGEIRNIIYAHVFDGTQYNFAEYSFGSEDNGGKLTSDESFKENNMGLLLVSRQIHEETALLPYKMGEFLIKTEAPDAAEGWECVRTFLEDRSQVQIMSMSRIEIWDSSLWREGFRIRSKKGKWWFETLGCKKSW
jgi:hypothetical protein